MRSKNIYIHIGPLKTGSTTIQQGLKLNETELKRIGYLCPETGRVNNKTTSNHNLSMQLLKRRRFSPDRGTWDDLLKEINQKGIPDNIILTSELFARLPAKKIREVQSMLDPHHIVMICYLRRQDKWLQSIWSEVTKNNRNGKEFSDWLENNNYVYAFSEYHKLINRWASILGKENVRVGILEKEQINEHLFHHFISACNIENPNRFQVPVNANVTPGPKIMEILRQVKAQLPEELPTEDVLLIGRIMQRYAEEQGWNDRKINKIDRDIYEKVMSIHAKSNQKTAKEYFGREELFLEPFIEKELTNFNIEEMERQELIDYFSYTLSELMKKKGVNNLDVGKNEQDLRAENRKLHGKVGEIRSSWIWKLIKRLQSFKQV